MWNFIKRTWCKAAPVAEFNGCELPAPLDLSQASRVLVFAPHPDDETLGCGGTLFKLAEHAKVKVVLVTDGSGAGGLPEGAAQVRQAEFRRALQHLRVSDCECWDQPDGAFEATEALAQRARKLLDDFAPDWVLLPSPLDYHADHVRISRFLRPLCHAAASVRQLVYFETWSPVPASHVVDITDCMAVKEAALQEHATALACGDYLRAVRGLCSYRGLYLGRERYAEAFWVERTDRPSHAGLLDQVTQSILRGLR